MENKLVTLAIHTKKKAFILGESLKRAGISVFFENQDPAGENIYIKVKEEDLSRALTIIEAEKVLSYRNEEITQIDDGKRRILVAVDFSSYSLNACRVAFDIAKQQNAKVKILHVYNNIYFPSNIPFSDLIKEDKDGNKIEDSIMDRARKEMLHLCNQIDQKISTNDFPSVNYSYSLREGTPEEEIDNFINEYKPYLLVVGLKGHHNNDVHILGNVTADIIETTNVPVLAVPEDSPLKKVDKLKRVVFLANTLSSDIDSFQLLVDSLVNIENKKITLLHVNRPDKKGIVWSEQDYKEQQTKIHDLYPGLNIDVKILTSDDIVTTVAHYVETEKADLLALRTKTRNLFTRIFVPSMSRKILLTSNAMLLVLR